MSEPIRIALVGATGLTGRAIIAATRGREDVRLTALARREQALPEGVRMEMFVADPSKWGEVFEAVRPTVLINALGTTWRKSGQSEDAFRDVDQRLVLDTARMAHAAGVERMVHISSVGADPVSKNFYLRVKGEVERDLQKLKFRRLDVMRPGLLRGERGSDRRGKERLAIALSPLMDMLLHGRHRRFRSIAATTLADGCLAAARKATQGRYIHENDNIMRLAKSLPRPMET